MDDDEETLCRYGTALPAYEEDEIPTKKPVSVEDQIVLDINGKRRFHGAFTGGFSAGYWNTVGSEEGWKPTEFKSSRGEKASLQARRPIDFMDDEDLGEFGIAPQRVQPKEDFAHSSKGTKRRITQSHWSGPIPGQPVLKSLLEPTREKTAVKILKNMGWREGQGVGERQSKVDKKKAKERNQKEMYVMKMYGCAIPGRSSQATTVEDSDSESDVSDYEVSFAPDDFDPLVAAIKDNTFGLGYSGLERSSSHTQRFNLFDTLEVVDKNNKKLSIRGQAFGIGAFEDDDDEDVYAKDDMSRYDFSLEDKAKKPAAVKSTEHAGGLEGFCPTQKSGKQIKKVFRVKMPEDYVPRNWTERRSRFEPMNDSKLKQFTENNQYKIQGLGRHDLDPKKRGKVLGEVPMKEPLSTPNPILELIKKRSENFVSGETINCDTPGSSKSIVEKSEKPKSDPLKFDLKAEMENLGSTKDGFKPFIADADKQERYDKFLSFQPSERYKVKEDFLSSLQPLGMSSWDRERELKEFGQAQRMYRPLEGLMSDRFVTESSLVAEKKDVDPANPMEIIMKRTRVMWKPHKELCKRFNVPEPFGGMLEHEKEKAKTKFSVFDYLETPVNSKRDFVTPVIIPKHVSKDERKQGDPKPVRVSAKDFFCEADKSTATVEISESRPAQMLNVTQPSHSHTLKKPEKRSELEQRVLDSVNKKPEQKKDLFRSIFCSSDEEDEDDQAKKAEQTMSEKEKLKLVESLVAIKPASQVNILRNDSPPRGIFKSILEIKRPKDTESGPVEIEDTEDSSSSSEDDAYYGPKLPMKPTMATSSTPSDDNLLDARLKTMVEKIKTGCMVEKWVEKDKPTPSKSKKKKHKEHKKSKKHKKDKKKHKHKEKR